MAGKKILVADDSLTIQKVIKLALSNEGYEIQAVSDGQDAVQQIAVYRPDVVLIDVSLPGKSAVEVKRITDAEPSSAHVRFVLMSSAFERVDEQQIKEGRFHGQLTKPFDPAHLRKVLTDVLGSVTSSPAQKNFAPAETLELNLPPLPDMPELAPDMDLVADGSAPSLDFEMPPSLEMPPLPSAPPEQRSATSTSKFQNKNEPPTPPAPADELWGNLSDLPNELPPQDPTAGGEFKAYEDSDIRHLTESTIRMSGLDDFDWTVKEPSSLSPGSEIGELSDSNFSFDSNPEPPLADGLQFETNEVPDAGISLSGPGLHSNHQAETPFQGISQEVVEQLIRKEVQEALEKVAQRILPDLAERVIKQEIHRLLSEQP